MKITASFVGPVRNWAPAWVSALGLITLLLIGTLSWLAVDATAKYRGKALLNDRLTEIESRMRERELIEALPPPAEWAALKQRVAALNSLTDARGWPAVTLLGRLETWLPAQALLVSLRHRVKDGEAVLVAEAENAEILTEFLLKLEKEPHFSEVLLSRQDTPSLRAGKLLQFELRLKERP